MTRYLAFAASQRAASHNARLARHAAVQLTASGAEVEWLDYAEIVPPTYDDQRYEEADLPPPVQRFLAALRRADGWLLASPEYNWSFPGSLKSLIDWVSLLRPSPMREKPVLLLSASPSRRGGLIGLQQLQQPLAAVGAQVYGRYFALAVEEASFDLHGRLQDAALQKELAEILAGFHRFTLRHADD